MFALQIALLVTTQASGVLSGWDARIDSRGVNVGVQARSEFPVTRIGVSSLAGDYLATPRSYCAVVTANGGVAVLGLDKKGMPPGTEDDVTLRAGGKDELVALPMNAAPTFSFGAKNVTLSFMNMAQGHDTNAWVQVWERGREGKLLHKVGPKTKSMFSDEQVFTALDQGAHLGLANVVVTHGVNGGGAAWDLSLSPLAAAQFAEGRDVRLIRTAPGSNSSLLVGDEYLSVWLYDHESKRMSKTREWKWQTRRHRQLG